MHDGRCRITPEILPLRKTDLFLEAFRDQRKFRDLLAQVPVQAVMNKQAPLTGAAYFALGETAIQ
ncbi:MAG: glucokinase [Nitrospinae bacterium]|nr:glucokinase [Nitrospinota bacterium]